MKKKIGLYLKQLRQPVVFLIDNLDRVEAGNILFLFKLIGSVFDLPNIIYVLAYDKKRIEEVFYHIDKVNPKYIEKIVQQEILIPEIQKNSMVTICSSCIERIFLSYGVSQGDLVRKYDELMSKYNELFEKRHPEKREERIKEELYKAY